MNHQKEKYIPALGSDRLTPLYDWVIRLTMREMTFKKALVGQARILPGQSVLDVGCGTGTLAVLIKKKHPEAIVSGIDGDTKILEIARAKAEKAGVIVEFDEGMSFDLSYADRKFDRVVSSLFFHHLTRANKLKTLGEIRRVLKPDGEFHLADFGHPSNFLMKITSEMVRRFDSPETTADNFDGLLQQIIEEAGFRAVRETSAFNSLFGTVRLYESRIS